MRRNSTPWPNCCACRTAFDVRLRLVLVEGLRPADAARQAGTTPRPSTAPWSAAAAASPWRRSSPALQSPLITQRPGRPVEALCGEAAGTESRTTSLPTGAAFVPCRAQHAA